MDSVGQSAQEILISGLSVSNFAFSVVHTLTLMGATVIVTFTKDEMALNA